MPMPHQILVRHERIAPSRRGTMRAPGHFLEQTKPAATEAPDQIATRAPPSIPAPRFIAFLARHE